MKTVESHNLITITFESSDDSLSCIAEAIIAGLRPLMPYAFLDDKGPYTFWVSRESVSLSNEGIKLGNEWIQWDKISAISFECIISPSGADVINIRFTLLKTQWGMKHEDE